MNNPVQSPMEKESFLRGLQGSLLQMANSPQEMEGQMINMPATMEDALAMIQMQQQEIEALKQQLSVGGAQVPQGGVPPNAAPPM